MATGDHNVLIHVFDEYRKTAKDFICRRDVLLEKMKYFRSYLNQSNELDEIDISVHCDVEIFEWLVEYMQPREPDSKPRIALDNIASILVSSEFLQMDALVEECIIFITGRMQDFIQLRVDFGCLSESTISKIADRCSADQLQQLQDPKDKILSKLLRRKLEALLRELQQGNSALRCCVNCDTLYLSSDEAQLHCSKSDRMLTVRGELLAVHQAKSGWTPEEWVSGIVQERGISWSGVYWFIWASTKCCICATCRRYCSLLEFHECAYHPGPVTGVGIEAKFSCCGARIFLCGEFDGVGCHTRDHTILASASLAQHESVELLIKNSDIIAAVKQSILGESLVKPAPTMDMSVVLGVRPPFVSPEQDAQLKKPQPPSADATSPRRQRQWQTLRLQEHDRVRMELLSKRLLQLRKNLTS
jgi:hypothetical protein